MWLFQKKNKSPSLKILSFKKVNSNHINKKCIQLKITENNKTEEKQLKTKGIHEV